MVLTRKRTQELGWSSLKKEPIQASFLGMRVASRVAASKGSEWAGGNVTGFETPKVEPEAVLLRSKKWDS